MDLCIIRYVEILSKSCVFHSQHVDKASIELDCFQIFDCLQDIESKHTKILAENNSLDNKQNGSEAAQSNQEESLQCQLCGTVCKNQKTYRKHRQGHLGKLKHVCDHCGKEYWNYVDLKGHISAKHSNKKEFSCNLCGTQFSYKKTLNEHVKKKSCPFLKENHNT